MNCVGTTLSHASHPSRLPAPAPWFLSAPPPLSRRFSLLSSRSVWGLSNRAVPGFPTDPPGPSRIGAQTDDHPRLERRNRAFSDAWGQQTPIRGRDPRTAGPAAGVTAQRAGTTCPAKRSPGPASSPPGEPPPWTAARPCCGARLSARARNSRRQTERSPAAGATRAPDGRGQVTTAIAQFMRDLERVWDEHREAALVRHDLAASLAQLAPEPSVWHLPAMTGAAGRP